MTIYLVRYMDLEIQHKKHYACSSYLNATKKVKELKKEPNTVVFESKDGGYVEKHQLKLQDQIIDLMNSL